jgi:hypothetical protein
LTVLNLQGTITDESKIMVHLGDIITAYRTNGKLMGRAEMQRTSEGPTNEFN